MGEYDAGNAFCERTSELLWWHVDRALQKQ